MKNSEICRRRILKLPRNWLKLLAPLNNRPLNKQMTCPETIWAHGIQPIHRFIKDVDFLDQFSTTRSISWQRHHLKCKTTGPTVESKLIAFVFVRLFVRDVVLRRPAFNFFTKMKQNQNIKSAHGGSKVVVLKNLSYDSIGWNDLYRLSDLTHVLKQWQESKLQTWNKKMNCPTV